MAERLAKALARYVQRRATWHSRRDVGHNELKASTNSDVWNGLLRTFRMLEEVTPANPQIPSETKHVQRRARHILIGVSVALGPYVNAVITRDNGNMAAKADIIVDGETIASNVPAVSLIALEKDFADLVTLVREIPEAPAGEEWEYDQQTRLLTSEPSVTLRTAQRMKSMITAAETERHPAQVHVFTDNVPVAEISSVRFHGGMQLEDKRRLVAAAEKVHLAIANAREEANASYETEPVIDIGEALVRLALPGIVD